MSTKHPLIHWQQCDTATLLGSYNLAARALGKPEVKRFSDRKAAVNRTFAIWNEYCDTRSRALNNGETIGDVLARDKRRAPDAKEIKAVHTPGKAAVAQARADAAKEALAAHPQAATPTPPVAEKKELWRRPKRVEPSRTAYRPRPGSLQARMYNVLAAPGGVPIDDFCAFMAASGSKDVMFHSPPGVWSGLCYLFVSQKGYGLRFDGERIELLVPKDERDQAKRGAS